MVAGRGRYTPRRRPTSVASNASYEANRGSATILVAPRWRRSTEARAHPASADRLERTALRRQIEIVGPSRARLRLTPSAHAASFAARYPKTPRRRRSRSALAGFGATAFGIAPMVAGRRRPAAAPGHRKRRRRPICGPARSPRRARLRAVPQRRHPRQRHRRQPARAAWASTTPPPPPSCAPTRSPASCSTAAPASMVQVRIDASRRARRAGRPLRRAGATTSSPTHFTRLRVERVAGKLVAYVDDWRRWPRSRAWPAARSAPRCSPRPTRPASRTRWRRSWPRSSRPTSTSTASCARATPSASSTRR